MIFGVYTKIRIVRLFSTNFSHRQEVTSLKSGIKYEVECFASLSEEYLHKKYGNIRDLGTWISWKLLQKLNLFFSISQCLFIACFMPGRVQLYVSISGVLLDTVLFFQFSSSVLPVQWQLCLKFAVVFILILSSSD